MAFSGEFRTFEKVLRKEEMVLMVSFYKLKLYFSKLNYNYINFNLYNISTFIFYWGKLNVIGDYRLMLKLFKKLIKKHRLLK